MNFNQLWQKILDFFGFETEVQYEDDDITQLNHKKSNNKIVSLNPNQDYQLIFRSPDSYNEVKSIVDKIKESSPVIVNTDALETKEARRLIDFISGAVYSLNGDVCKAGKGVFLFTPGSIEIEGEALNEMINQKMEHKL